MPTTALLIKNIHTLVPMDAQNQVLRGAHLYAENGEIRRVGSGTARLPKADKVIDGRHFIALPGLVNTHHHLYQTLTRAYAPAADAKLFDWLRTLYPIWARLDEECAEVAALAGMAELLLSGCTTTSDHHYLFPRGCGPLIDAQIAAARRIGMRFHPTRGSMSVGRTQGGLPPDSVVQGEERILQDCERLIGKFHDAAPGSMLRVALAPCSPFSVSPELMRASARLARRHGLRLHTPLARHRAGAGAAPRRMSGGARGGRQRFQRQLAHAGRGPPGVAAPTRALWGGGTVGSRRLAHGDGGGR